MLRKPPSGRLVAWAPGAVPVAHLSAEATPRDETHAPQGEVAFDPSGPEARGPLDVATRGHFEQLTDSGNQPRHRDLSVMTFSLLVEAVAQKPHRSTH
jgi:hypothetical protein